MKALAVAAAIVALVPLGAAQAQPAPAPAAKPPPVQAQPAQAQAAQAQRAPRGRTCFRANNVSSFRSPDNRTVYVRAGVRDIFRLELMGSCPNINWSNRVAIRTRGSQWICSGLGAEIVAQSSTGPRRCPVRSLRKLTPEEVAALPPRSRP